MKRMLVALPLLAGAVDASRTGQPESREKIPEVMRPVLRPTMGRHGEDMLQLVSAVTLLQYPVIQQAAGRIATEPTVARPVSEPPDSEVRMPERFYRLQGELKQRAQALRNAARSHDDAALGQQLGLMMQACVSCHSSFMVRPGKDKAPVPSNP